MPDAKKHRDNTIIMEQPIVLALNLEIGHGITQNILYICIDIHTGLSPARRPGRSAIQQISNAIQMFYCVK